MCNIELYISESSSYVIQVLNDSINSVGRYSNIERRSSDKNLDKLIISINDKAY